MGSPDATYIGDELAQAERDLETAEALGVTGREGQSAAIESHARLQRLQTETEEQATHRDALMDRLLVVFDIETENSDAQSS
jgi:hypothetical protein